MSEENSPKGIPIFISLLSFYLLWSFLSLSHREKWNSNVQYLDSFLHLINFFFLNGRKNELIQVKGMKTSRRRPKINLVEAIKNDISIKEVTDFFSVDYDFK